MLSLASLSSLTVTRGISDIGSQLLHFLYFLEERLQVPLQSLLPSRKDAEALTAHPI